MTLDQWIQIFKDEQTKFPIPKFVNHDLCSTVTRLHEQKDRLVEAVVGVQRSNIGKAIQQNELFSKENDLFENSNSSMGSDGANR